MLYGIMVAQEENKVENMEILCKWNVNLHISDQLARKKWSTSRKVICLFWGNFCLICMFHSFAFQPVPQKILAIKLKAP